MQLCTAQRPCQAGSMPVRALRAAASHCSGWPTARQLAAILHATTGSSFDTNARLLSEPCTPVQVPPVQVHCGRRVAARRGAALHARPAGQRQQLALRAAAREPSPVRVRCPSRPNAGETGTVNSKRRLSRSSLVVRPAGDAGGVQRGVHGVIGTGQGQLAPCPCNGAHGPVVPAPDPEVCARGRRPTSQLWQGPSRRA